MENLVTRSLSNGKGLTRVLIQIRPNVFAQRGGDTVVVERLSEGLQARGIKVTVDTAGREDPRGYDLVHLFNFALPDLLRAQGERAYQSGVPFVVSTLCEDVPTFHNQSWALARALLEFCAQGQNEAVWRDKKDSWRRATPSPRFENEWIARHAAALMPNGEGEAATLRREYPGLSSMRIVPVGHEPPTASDPEPFIRTHGVQDFVFCVGRIESRKNQLMLLKALEDSDLTVVLAGGGFTYQPDYDRAVRNFKRRGRTIILDALTPQMLASAYAASRIHVLPSWYELPGLVTLEAASHGKNVVVTDTGTTRDYVGQTAVYCDPWDATSIRNAVYAAFYSPVDTGLKVQARQFTWDRMVERTIQVYQEIAARPTSRQSSQVVAQPSSTASVALNDIAPSVEQAERFAREGKFAEAEALLSELSRDFPNDGWVLRTQGAIALAQGKSSDARQCFARALQAVPEEVRSEIGLAMCDGADNQWDAAHQQFARIVARNPQQTIALQQLVECSYRVQRFEELEAALSRFVAMTPNQPEWRFCWAGALYKLGRVDDAAREIAIVLQEVPNHRGAGELATRIAELKTSAPAEHASSTKPSTERFDAVDKQIVMLEDAKRSRRYDDVLRGVADVLASPGITADQREKARILQAEIAILQGRIKDARPIYEDVLHRNARSARAICGIAALEASEGSWNKAQEFFEQARAIDPNYDLPLTGLGLCAATAGKSEEAWVLYSQALRCNCENTRALLGLIELAYALGRVGQIEAPLREYLDLHPADVDFMYSFAGCLFAQSKLDEAKIEIEKLMIFDPHHSHALELRAMIEERERGVTGRAQGA